MVRSSWKNLYLHQSLYRAFKNKKKVFFIWSRNSCILPFFLNKIVYVHNGLKFEKLLVNESMLYYKFGDFIFTKKRGKFIHKIIKNKKKKKKK